MKYHSLLLIGMVLLFGRMAPAQDTADSVDQGAYNTAFMDKIIECYEQEGGALMPGDRAVLERSLGQLSGMIQRQASNGSGQNGSGDENCFKTQSAECVENIRQIQCNQLAQQMTNTNEGLLPLGAAPAWAIDYVATLSDKIIACYKEEGNTTLSQSDQDKIAGFKEKMARVLGLFTADGRCQIDQEAKLNCTTSIMGMKCSDMANFVATGDIAMFQSMMKVCGGFLKCGDPLAKLFKD